MKDVNEKYKDPDWDRIAHLFKIAFQDTLKKP